MLQTLGQIKTYDTVNGMEEALCFVHEGKEHWVKRYLNNDRYQVCGFLGTGGLGCVYTAYDRWNCDNMVVIKTPYYMGDYCFPYISRGKAVFERQINSLNKIYLREKKHLVELSNAGFDSVVNLNDFFYDRSVDLCKSFHNAARVKYQVTENYRENTPFLVMKYIRGQTLGKIIEEKTLGNYKTLVIAKQILALMKYMHKRRVSNKGKEYYYLLCDLKADNIIVTDDMHISLIDFGAVKIYWTGHGEVDIPIFVTAGYAAPEVYSGSLEFIDNPRIDERFDLFTLGALMSYCLTGIQPKDFLVNTTPPQHNFDLDHYDNITKNVKNIIKKSTMHQRQERYQNSSTMLYEVLNELSRFQGQCMKFSPGQTIDGYLYFNKNRSNIAYKVKVMELLFAGDHFHYYKALNCNGDHVCIKIIRYRSEGRNIFSSAVDYVKHRRKMLLNEHRILSISHPSIPEPLAMITVENNCDEDEKLFHKSPDWQHLKTQELILVQEYLAGSPLPKLQDQIQLFSIKQRLNIFHKLIKLFSYVHEQGFVIQNLHPEHIMMNPEHNDNINIVGLHYSCPLKSVENTAKYKKALLLSGQKTPARYRPDVRTDVRQLGAILHYLLTLQHTASNEEIDLNVTKKALEQLSSHHSWVLKLVEQLLCKSIHKRLHSATCIANYLHNPPQQDIDFEIVKASRSQLEIKITRAPNWGEQLELRVEDNEKGTITENKVAFSNSITIQGKWSGEITCGIRAVNANSFTWWKYKNVLAAQKFPLSEIPDLPTDQVGFEWPAMPNLKNVSFFLEENNRLTKLCDAQTKVILPVDGQPLPNNKKIKIVCQPNFLRQEQNPMQIVQEVYLVPTINTPIVYNKLNQIFFEITLDEQQRKIISQIELLHNGAPYRTQIKEDFVQQIHGEKIVFKLNKRNLLMFENHVFSCRILLDSIGWKKGPSWQVDISPPGIQSLAIEESTMGTLQLSWRSYPNKYLRDYGVFYNGEEIAKTADCHYELQLDNTTISREMGNSATIEVVSYYECDGITKQSQPYAKEYLFPTIENILRCSIKRSISPKSVTFELDFKHFHIVQDFFYIYFYRQGKNDTSLISKSILRKTMSLKDEKVAPGETYTYFAEVEGVKYRIFDETQEIPQIGITCSLEKVGYETCSWLIRIDGKTLQYMDENIEIQRLGPQQKTHKFTWDKRKTSLQFTDKYLIPGEEFEYYFYWYLENEERHEYFLGHVVTKKFDLEVDVTTTYNSSNISWKPSPQDKIDCIQIYRDDKFLAATKSDSITLQNLEPEYEYTFPLKYKYLSGYIQQGTAIKFKTRPYKMKAETTDFATDSFRLKWEIADSDFAMKLKNLLLKVSANVGEHELSPSTRSVQLKQLLPCTTYQWTIHGQLTSGRKCLLASGDATTDTPGLKVDIDVGLIHHIKWEYKKIPAISKIEVHRNDLPLIETDEDELYDSDFKGGKEITYRFFYVMSDGRKLLATEKKVQSLSMKDLFSAIKIQPKTGAIHWDFSELKRYTFFQSVELFLNNKSLFHQENSNGSLTFEDWGQNAKGGKNIGLPEKSMNFELAVVGIAPIKRKCKKKWTLSIKGIKCYYSNLPYQFNVFREYSSIYFQWEKMPTELLEEVVLERLSDNRVIYSGINEEVYIVDDNDGYGLEAHTSYQYIMKLKYKNHQTLKKIEVLLEDFDEDRLNITEEQVSNATLKISWDSELDTSITHIGWCKSLQSFVPKFLKRYHFVDFAQGKMNIPIQPQDMSYELVYKDCYNNIFYGVRRHMPKELIKQE